MIPHSEHMSLHAKLKHKNGILITPSFKNHHHTKEAKEKISITSKSRKHCGNPNIMKKVQCIETGDVYESTHDAELKLNLRPGSVRCQINPKQTNQHCYLQDGSKIHFKYI